MPSVALQCVFFFIPGTFCEMMPASEHYSEDAASIGEPLTSTVASLASTPENDDDVAQLESIADVEADDEADLGGVGLAGWGLAAVDHNEDGLDDLIDDLRSNRCHTLYFILYTLHDRIDDLRFNRCHTTPYGTV